MFQNLPGFRSFYPEQYSAHTHLRKVWARSARIFGFAEYNTPVLEPLELFTAKSGDEIVKQLFNFEDQGGRAIALRPEMTPSLARLIGAKANSLPKPIKWFSSAEFFRYERPQKGRLRSFYQFNVDILGEAGTSADAELMACLVHTLCAFGLTQKDFILRLSDRNLWVYYLQAFGLDEAAIEQTLSVIDKLSGDFTEAEYDKFKPVLGDHIDLFWGELKALIELRTLEELESFFASSKAPHAIASIDERMRDWKALVEELQALGLNECLRIDFSIVRGLAYYTGFVFEVFESSGNGRALAGGGRYDHLVKKLGGPDLPAVGFAMGDVTMLDLLEEKGLIPQYVQTPDVYLVASCPEEKKLALSDATAIRNNGYSVEYSLKKASFNKQFKTVNQLKPAVTIIYSTEELSQGLVKLYNSQTREEVKYPRCDLLLGIERLSSEGWRSLHSQQA